MPHQPPKALVEALGVVIGFEFPRGVDELFTLTPKLARCCFLGHVEQSS